MWVKICGITRPEDAQVALEAGADALGFVFEPHSPRHLPHHPDWRQWLSQLSGALRVAVFVSRENLPADLTLFDALQWTPPSPEALETELPALLAYQKSLWVALRLPPERSAEEALQHIARVASCVERIVLDSYHPTQFGGTGETHDWARARQICARSPLPVILAGGLNPENVADAIHQVRPFGVDVSSGVETTPGLKDAEKVRAFLRRAKEADAL
ncbi:phosphoribosylanthranilate isomerase [Armatimonadetes bacterium DC]|nr:phosphoribosylanthranilate isomerase [Armatimonadetes bacterium DC]